VPLYIAFIQISCKYYRDAIWGANSGGPKELCVRLRVQIPQGWGTILRVVWPIQKHCESWWSVCKNSWTDRDAGWWADLCGVEIWGSSTSFKSTVSQYCIPQQKINNDISYDLRSKKDHSVVNNRMQCKGSCNRQKQHHMRCGLSKFFDLLFRPHIVKITIKPSAKHVLFLCHLSVSTLDRTGTVGLSVEMNGYCWHQTRLHIGTAWPVAMINWSRAS